MNQLRLVLWLYCWVRERELNLRDSAPNQSADGQGCSDNEPLVVSIDGRKQKYSGKWNASVFCLLKDVK